MTEQIEKNSKSLYQALWNSADILRSKMDANEYKSYLLGLVFYKYLSDNMLRYVSVLLEEETDDLNKAQDLYVEAFKDADIKDDLLYELKDEFSYTIAPALTFTAQVAAIHDGSFQLEDLVQGFRDIEQSSENFENLFEDIDLYSKKLGSTPQKQNKTIADVMKELEGLNMAGHAGDVLGDAYEYLIGQFASESGKKAGEFYTPQPVAKLMTQIVLQGKEDKKGFSVYDATMGSGSLLLNAKKYSHQPGTISYFGQELNTSTYNLARMNMILHGVPIANQHLHNADTLDQDWPTEEPTNFDGVLFRGGAEGKIRKALLENGAIDTVIGLPANIFFNTSIPTTVIILKKDRAKKDVLFIDASQDFEKIKTQNTLRDYHIDAILEAYKTRTIKDKYAYVAEFDEIVENDYNLNIPRYVDTFEEE
ncbi:TPA: SAM-dependent DNA methyltransferase, partial [Enterococcus faecium]|nr:SAM-dependent DNA methyltransferase [Enterococcus faecium]